MDQKDYLFERHKILRHQRRLYFMFGVLLVVIFFNVFSEGFERVTSAPKISKNKDHIARIYVDGMIFADQGVVENLASIGQDDSIKAVILRMNSPGGSATMSEILTNELLKILANKPIVTVVEEIAASGGYMVSLASDYIFANHTSIIGSIGVYTDYFEFTELAKNLGIGVGTIKSAPLKATPNSFEKVTTEVLEAQEYFLEDIFKFFKNIVQQRRGMTDKEIELVADARIFTGIQAIDFKLIDAIGQENEALTWLSENRDVAEDLEVRDYDLYKKPTNKFLDIVGVFSEHLFSFVNSKLLMRNSTPQLKANLNF